MKKATLTIGVFTLVLALTSFANPTTATASNLDNTVITAIDGTGGQDVGGNKKVDYNGNSLIVNSTNKILEIDGNGGQDVGGNKKVD
jgi:hypothetical protein